jgi:hypothetical protein
MKVVVAVSALLSLVVVVVLFQLVPGFLRPVTGDWTGLVSFVINVWSMLLMTLGNMGLWWFGTGFKKSVTR